MADLTTNNIHYYSFQSNANDSIGSTNGTVGGATNTAGGINGNCYSYDGLNDVITYGTTTAPTDLILTTGTSYSLSLWVNPITLTGTTNYWFGLVGTYARHGIAAQTNTGRLLIGMRSATVAVTKASLITITAATWTHLAITYSPTTKLVKLYKNGVYSDFADVSTVTGDQSYTVAWKSGNNQAILGGNGSFFNGLIDELSFWSRTLTDSEIEALYRYGIGNFYPYETYFNKKFNRIQMPIARINRIPGLLIKKINRL